jgi:drug/metabolite transporter (DMT)-like permease
VGVVLALIGAVSYGASDFIAGLMTRRAGSWSVVAVAQTAAVVCLLVVLPFLPGSLTARGFAWGALAGVGTTIGTLALYRGLAQARMNVVAPLSGVIAAMLPVVVGLATGERPSTPALIGIGVALAAIVLVSLSAAPEEAERPSGVIEGLVAGAGFGLLFIALQRAGSSAGAWPVLASELVSVVAVVAIALVRHYPLVPGVKDLPGISAVGVLGAGATVLYLYATAHGLLSLVAVLISLYPAATVILAAVVLRERSTRVQVIGMLCAVVAVVLIARG